MHSKTKRLYRKILGHLLDRKNRSGVFCNRCGKNVCNNHDYFMIWDELWHVIASKKGAHEDDVYCKRCSERYLGRKLTRADLNTAPLNEWLDWR